MELPHRFLAWELRALPKDCGRCNRYGNQRCRAFSSMPRTQHLRLSILEPKEGEQSHKFLATIACKVSTYVMRNSLLVVLCWRLDDRTLRRLSWSIVDRFACLFGNWNQIIQSDRQQVQLRLGGFYDVLSMVESFLDGFATAQGAVIRQQEDFRMWTQASYELLTLLRLV